MISNKFILLHIDNQDSNNFLKDAISNEGVERGVYFRSSFLQELKEQFSYMKERGYFPIGVVVDFENSNKIEYLFKRHPNQTDKMKLVELKHDNPIVL
jgi:hypothetical protein